MQDIAASDLPNADGFLRRSALRVLAWVQAGMAYLHYGYMDWISTQSTPFTATDEYLEGWAALAPTPVLREAPTFASGPATWAGLNTTPLPSGTLCSGSDLTQFTTVGNATVSGGFVTTTVVAVIAGSAGNTDSGAPLTLSTTIPGITSLGSATGPITGGNDLELDAAMRSRMLESYAQPPHGGNTSDYVTWALSVTGVTRAWAGPDASAGSVSVYVMLDVAEAAFNGFPQGSNGGATLETRTAAATGDQLGVANLIYPLRPVTAIVIVIAPIAALQNFTLSGLTSISGTQQASVVAAISSLFLALDTPLATTSIQQSDIDSAIVAVGGLPNFAVTSPSSWPITSTAGHLFEIGTVTYV